MTPSAHFKISISTSRHSCRQLLTGQLVPFQPCMGLQHLLLPAARQPMATMFSIAHALWPTSSCRTSNESMAAYVMLFC